MASGTELDRLADFVTSRRVELSIDVEELARRMGVSDKTVRRIENGISVKRDTYAKLEQELRWLPGSVRRVTENRGEPEPATRVVAGPPPLTNEDQVRFSILKDTIRAEDLTDDLRVALLRHLFESAGGRLTPETLDLWLNDPNRLKAIRAAANLNETEQVTPSERS